MHAISLIELPNKIAILRRNTTQNKKKKKVKIMLTTAC